MKRLIILVAMSASAAFGYEKAIYDAIDLSGTWEMAYEGERIQKQKAKLAISEKVPKFEGEVVESVVPAYWEDLPQFAKYAIPFTPEPFPMRKRIHTIIPGQISGAFAYRRTIELKEVKPNAYLAFEIVRNNIQAWVNGKYLGRHSGFLTPFEMAIPEGALVAGKNEIVLLVDNFGAVGVTPRHNCGGGTTSRAIFLHTGGIAGRCELRFAKSDIEDVYVTTAEDLKTFTVHVKGSAAFVWKILDGENVVRNGKAKGDFTEPTQGLEFWSPEHPKRYTLALNLSTPNAQRPTFSTRFGIRRLVARGEKLYLNGEPVYLRGVCDHCYYAKTMHLSLDIDYYRMVVRKRKECGFNFVRFHTYVPPEAFFEAMDELGYLAHVETPHKMSTDGYAEVVAFARKHPCAVIYCCGNEDGVTPELQEALPKYAASVHAMSDGLFSPISALRGCEYALTKGEPVAEKPFKHNPERMAYYASFSDLFTSFQLGYVSYGSLDSGSTEELDRMGDAYCGKPRLSHEICIDGSYVDFSTEKLYPPDSPFLKVGVFEGIRRQLKQKGLWDRRDIYYRNSCEWMRRIRKHAFEKLRGSARTQGFDFLGDINTHWHTCGYSCGLFDEFYRMKPGETAENVRRYNSAAVLLTDLGNNFVFTAGETKKVGFKVSNYDAASKGGRLKVELASAEGAAVLTKTFSVGALAKGEVIALPSWDMALPEDAKPRKYLLHASLDAGTFKASNQWEVYAFPKTSAATPQGVTILGNKATREQLLAELAAGKRVLVYGQGPFNGLDTNFRIGLAGRSAGNFATIIREHPIFRDFPHEGYCGWQFKKLMERGKAVQLEGSVPFDPIVDIASSAKVVIRQALMFEYRVGDGRLLVCGFKFHDDDPASQYLKAKVYDYVASDAFAPKDAITPEQLAAVIDAPIVTGSKDTNRANDTNVN